MSNTRNKTHKRNYLLLFYLALGTKKMNHILDRIGVEKFGSQSVRLPQK